MNYPLSTGGALKQHRTETYPETLLGFMKIFYFCLNPFFPACWVFLVVVGVFFGVMSLPVWFVAAIRPVSTAQSSTMSCDVSLQLGTLLDVPIGSPLRWAGVAEPCANICPAGRTSSPLVGLKMGPWGSWGGSGGRDAKCLIGTRRCGDSCALVTATVWHQPRLLPGTRSWNWVQERSPLAHRSPPAPLRVFVVSNQCSCRLGGVWASVVQWYYLC